MALNNGSMTVSVTTKCSGSIASQGNAPANAVSPPAVSPSSGRTQALAYGTGSGQADIYVCAEVQINATSSATYDLYTGTDLRDLFGGAAPFRKIKSLVVEVRSGGDTAGVAVGGASSNEWAGFFAAAGDKLKIFPSGIPFAVGSPAGVAVGASTCNLKIENLGAVAVVLRICAGGTSA